MPGEKLNQNSFLDSLGYCPEQKLLAAFLMRNFNDAIGNISWNAKKLIHGHESAVSVVASARRWFYSQETGPYTFINTCERLDISPKTILELIKKKKQGNFAIFWQMELI